MEALGPKLRRHRRRLGLTLDELAGRTGISKPYLSLIETERVANPPSDEKLRRLEQTLGFTTGELLTQAHLQRTPTDVRAMLMSLMGQARQTATADGKNNTEPASIAHNSQKSPTSPSPGGLLQETLSLDAAYMSGVLQEWVDRTASNVRQVASGVVPLINRVSAGYPRDFTDLSYPSKVADEYVGCPDVVDPQAFASRVCGDSMMPKYRDGDIVIFSPAAVPLNGSDCFVRFDDGQTTFKRVFFEAPDAAVLRLQPRNEKYRPQSVPREQISGLYKAVYKYQNVDEE